MLVKSQLSAVRHSNSAPSDGGLPIVIRSVHPYPAMMAPEIVFDALHGHDKPLRLLDPMAGSGTSLQVGRACGHDVFGFDIDPLAVLIASTNCSRLDPEQLVEASRRVANMAENKAVALDDMATFPVRSDQETQEFVKFWFDPANRREIAALAQAIRRLRITTEMRMALWTILSGTIVTKKIGVSLAADVSHSRPHRIYDQAPVKAIDAFLRRASRVAGTISRSPIFDGTRLAAVRKGDAKKLPMAAGSIDCVITSPPYISAIDYLRGHRLSLVWLGYTLTQIRLINRPRPKRRVPEPIRRIAAASMSTSNLGTPSRSLTKLVEGYTAEMGAVTKEIARTLVPGGTAVIVVGNPTITGTHVDTAEIFKALNSLIGLHLVSESTRPIPGSSRYLPPPGSMPRNSPLSKRLAEEAILTLVKPR